MHLGGAVYDPLGCCLDPIAAQRKFVRDAQRSVDLYRPADYVAEHAGGHDFHRSDADFRVLIPAIDHPCSMQYEQPELLQFDIGIGDGREYALSGGEGTASCVAADRALL